MLVEAGWPCVRICSANLPGMRDARHACVAVGHSEETSTGDVLPPELGSGPVDRTIIRDMRRVMETLY